jgi:hypothetical protein
MQPLEHGILLPAEVWRLLSTRFPAQQESDLGPPLSKFMNSQVSQKFSTLPKAHVLGLLLVNFILPDAKISRRQRRLKVSN